MFIGVQVSLSHIGLLGTHSIDSFSSVVEPWSIDFCDPPISPLPFTRSLIFPFICGRWFLLLGMGRMRIGYGLPPICIRIRMRIRSSVDADTDTVITIVMNAGLSIYCHMMKLNSCLTTVKAPSMIPLCL